MKNEHGFTLIELIIFIVVLGIIATTILISLQTVLRYAPVSQQITVASQTADRCIEWYLGQRAINGYSSIACPSTSVPEFCTAPNGYTISTNVTCTTLYSEPTANYKTITVTVGGKQNATLKTLIANY